MVARAASNARRAGGVAGVLHGDHVARLDEDLGQQRQRLLYAVGDDQVVGADVQPARDSQVPRDRGAQHGRSRGVGVHGAQAGPADDAVDVPTPGRVGNPRVVGYAAAEVELRRLAVEDRHLRRRAPPQRHRRQRRRRSLRGSGGRVGVGADEGADAGARVDVALGEEMVEGRGDCVAGDPERQRQLAAGREPRLARKPAAQDRAPDLLVDLLGQTAALVEGEMQVHAPGCEVLRLRAHPAPL